MQNRLMNALDTTTPDLFCHATVFNIFRGVSGEKHQVSSMTWRNYTSIG